MGRLSSLFGSDGRRRDGGATRLTAEQQHEQALLLLRDYEDSGAGWFWATNAEGRVIYISQCIAQRLECPHAELLDRQVQSLFILERDENDGVERTLPLLLSARKTFNDLAVRAAVDGHEVWWSISGRPQFDGEGNFIGYRGNGTDVTALRQSQRDASRLAEYDSLTGLANRHRMGKRLVSTLNAYQAAKRPCAVMMIDLDRFKQVNDTLGHPAGDELLKQVGQRLQSIVLEKGCEIGRLGGDEFQIMLPDIDDRGRLGEVAQKIIQMVSQPYQVGGSRVVIGASVGVAISPYDGVGADDLVRSADLALYASKGGGRGQFRFYSSDLHSEAERRRMIEDDLRDALAREQIWLAYQPIVETKTDRVIGVESLLRWTHPELGEVSPAVFIPIAEEAGLIGPLGDWALKQACADAASWPGSIRVAVNVSPVQFTNVGFASVVAQALANARLDPERLELELTESIFLNDDQTTDEAFSSLKLLGVRLALDDFGTGYSSLGYLRKAPFDKIKIDQGFIRGVTEPGSRNRAIISAIVSLATALDMDTTAEGIEAHDELGLMRELGVKQIQGYIYAQPVPGIMVAEALENGTWTIKPDGPSKYRPERRAVLRKVGLIHEDHRYEVTMRNLSRTGAMIEGLVEVPVGEMFVVDFGEGQLAVAQVRRSAGAMQGLEFETPLVDDGAGGLCTRHRVSPYLVVQAGMQLAPLQPGQSQLPGMAPGALPLSLPKFGQANDRARGNRAA